MTGSRPAANLQWRFLLNEIIECCKDCSIKVKEIALILRKHLAGDDIHLSVLIITTTWNPVHSTDLEDSFINKLQELSGLHCQLYQVLNRKQTNNLQHNSKTCLNLRDPITRIVRIRKLSNIRRNRNVPIETLGIILNVTSLHIQRNPAQGPLYSLC